ncbi:Hypothetical predicted protein [Octopus vulgaris]|uniref:Uncharacterized protein n=1 Tax=Octopus vulgaris TaxID=6645 RepID=A0AA36AXT2_OCTVU|nr:Hypothetical predicted protein [Octopus vulgaris]
MINKYESLTNAFYVMEQETRTYRETLHSLLTDRYQNENQSRTGVDPHKLNSTTQKILKECYELNLEKEAYEKKTQTSKSDAIRDKMKSKNILKSKIHWLQEYENNYGKNQIKPKHRPTTTAVRTQNAIKVLNCL